MSCMQYSSSYYCASSFESCINRYSSYEYDCGGLEIYSVMQLLLASLAFLTDIILIVVASKHHKCCATSCCTSCESTPVSVPMTVPATGYTPVQVPAGMVYMVPQGYAPPPNYGVPMHAGQVQPQMVATPAGHFNNAMVGDAGQHQAY
eukprot:TRINITY_DN15954_c0_g1_i1.p1 TRINITY_DN15954_c0_g1~~TRINITY_DN15954_c0_g1_i1.p1  ORF type:complete len:148 (-),score=16.43 TRINITY_DN15954_c0_g1_i1:20-463(-)